MDKKTKPDRNFKYWLRLLSVGILGGLLIALAAVEVAYIAHMTRPIPSSAGDPPAGYQEVSLTSPRDGIQLAGWYRPSQNGAAVILLHGYGASRREMLPRAQILAAEGYGVLLYDERGHGESGGRLRAMGWPDLEDVGAALDFLKGREEIDPSRVGILGFSIGGQIALRAAAQYPEIQAVAADDPGFVSPADAPLPENFQERVVYAVSYVDAWGIRLRSGIPIPAGVPEILGQIPPRPILFIATGEGGGRALVRSFYARAGEPKQLWEIPETYHGGQLEARPVEYAERVVDFFNESLLGE